jgi:hypothetical protein
LAECEWTVLRCPGGEKGSLASRIAKDHQPT